MSSTCSSCASRTGSSCPTCSGDGSSVGLLLGVAVLLESWSWSADCGSVNDGEWAAATNGEMLGSVARVDVPAVSTLRVGAGKKRR